MTLDGNGASYIRISDDSQDVARQRKSIADWLGRHRLQVRSEYAFEDRGFVRDQPERRPDFVRLMATAKRGLIRWIVVDRQDRFGTKDAWQFASYVYQLREAGCHLVTTEGQVLTDDNLASFVTGGVGAETSAREQREKSHRVLTKKIESAKRGDYQGGFVPFGLDVACFDRAGREVWRVIFDGGRHARIKRSPGRPDERYDGKGNFPSRDEGQRLQLVPSRDKKRLAAVRMIFEEFASTSTDPSKLARKLNEIGTPYHLGPRWSYTHIREILKNPIYIGHQSSNKNGQGRFYEFVDGQTQAVTTTKQRRRSKDQWILSDHLGFEIVPKKTFEAVQKKIGGNPIKRRSPRSPDLWLYGVLFCSHCGKPMRGQNRGTRLEYFCSSYAKGEGCHRNAINHDAALELVERYLAETETELAAIVEAQDTGDLSLLEPYRESHLAALRRQGALAADIRDYVTSKRGWKKAFAEAVLANPKKGLLNLEGGKVQVEFGLTDYLRPIYERYFLPEADGHRERLAALQAEHATLLDRVLSLPPSAKRAIEAANARILDVEAQMDAAEAATVNLVDEFDQAKAEVARTLEAFREAAKALRKNDAAKARELAEAVRRVIDRIDLEFTPTGKKYPTTVLEAATITPQAGSPVKYPNRVEGTRCTSPRACSSTTTRAGCTRTTRRGWKGSRRSTPRRPATPTTGRGRTTRTRT